MRPTLLIRCLLLVAGLLAGDSSWAAQTVLVWGDSLSAGYGVDARRGWVHLLEQKLAKQADGALKGWRVVNGSVSGETTAGGLARLPNALKRHRPDVVLIELGGNDGLRGLNLKTMRSNLDRMVALARDAGAEPVIFEMRIPENYGTAVTRRFRATFSDIAEATDTALVPFFLAPLVQDRPRWFQDDGIHPTAEAQPLMLEAAWPHLAPVLKSVAAASR
jgi:acyl-CoA thioesterase-1